MRHPRLLIAVLAFGTVAGFGAGFASLHHHHACCAGWQDRHDGHEARESHEARATGEAESPAPAPAR